MTATEEIVIHPRSKLPEDKIPRVKKGPLGLLTWFKTMTERYGDHPRFVAECTDILIKAGIEPHEITEAILIQATRECLPLAKEWAKEHNAAELRGEAIGVVVVHDEYWLTGRHPDPTVRRKKAEQIEKINQREVEEEAPATYNTTVTETEPNTPKEQEIETMSATATATKPEKVDLTPKPLRVSDTAAVALLKNLGFLNADKYDAKKLSEKLGRLGKAGPGDDAEPNEASQKLLKKLAIAVNDGQEIEIVSADKAKPDPSTNGHTPKKGGKKDKKAKPDKPADDFGPTETATDAPKKKKGDKPAKEKPVKPAKNKPAKPAGAERDKFGSRIGTDAAKFNAAIGKKAKSVRELVDASGVEVKLFHKTEGDAGVPQLGAYYGQIKKLIEAGHVKQVENGYVLA